MINDESINFLDNYTKVSWSLLITKVGVAKRSVIATPSVIYCYACEVAMLLLACTSKRVVRWCVLVFTTQAHVSSTVQYISTQRIDSANQFSHINCTEYPLMYCKSMLWQSLNTLPINSPT